MFFVFALIVSTFDSNVQKDLIVNKCKSSRIIFDNNNVLEHSLLKCPESIVFHDNGRNLEINFGILYSTDDLKFLMIVKKEASISDQFNLVALNINSDKVSLSEIASIGKYDPHLTSATTISIFSLPINYLMKYKDRQYHCKMYFNCSYMIDNFLCNFNKQQNDMMFDLFDIYCLMLDMKNHNIDVYKTINMQSYTNAKFVSSQMPSAKPTVQHNNNLLVLNTVSNISNKQKTLNVDKPLALPIIETKLRPAVEINNINIEHKIDKREIKTKINIAESNESRILTAQDKVDVVFKNTDNKLVVHIINKTNNNINKVLLRIYGHNNMYKVIWVNGLKPQENKIVALNINWRKYSFDLEVE